MVSPDPRKELVDCERQIQQIKTALRKIDTEEGAGAGAGGDDAAAAAANSLQVLWVGMDGATDSKGMEVSLQLSSPVEEASLTKLHDDDIEVEGSSASFRGVESSMATLTVTLKTVDGGAIVGTSESYDLAPICSLENDAMNPKEEYITELPVAIMAAEGTTTAAATEEEAPAAAAVAETEEKQPVGDDAVEEAAKDEEGKSAAAVTEEATKDDAAAATSVIKPAATLTLKLVFKPSAKDLKEELYELLNKTSLRKSEAVSLLREQQNSALAKQSPAANKKGAVKPGFLNKKPKKSEDGKLKLFYDKYMGPMSMARGLIIPIAKNYVIFFGTALLMHFKGHELALPAPV